MPLERVLEDLLLKARIMMTDEELKEAIRDAENDVKSLSSPPPRGHY